MLPQSFLNNVYTSTRLRQTIAIGFKYSGGIFVAINAPRIEPKNDNGNNLPTIFKSTFFERKKDNVDVNDPKEEASLFVPSAMDGGIPVASRAGILMSPPPPTTESINAAKNPKNIKMSKIFKSMLPSL